MDIEEIRTLTSLMADNDLSELIIRDGEKRIVIRRGSTQVSTAWHTAPPPPPPVAQPHVAQPSPAHTTQSADVAPAEDPNLAKVTSPMVGTFYASPDPESPPFVNVGDRVTPDTVIGIIEAMKVFNEIKSEVAGTVEAVHADNASPVEFGQVLLTVRTA